MLEILSPAETATACTRMLCLMALGGWGEGTPTASHKIWGWMRLFYNPSFTGPVASCTNRSYKPLQTQVLTTPCPLVTIHSRNPQTWKFHCDTLTSYSFLGAEGTDTAHRLMLSDPEAALLLMYVFLMRMSQDRTRE